MCVLLELEFCNKWHLQASSCSCNQDRIVWHAWHFIVPYIRNDLQLSGTLGVGIQFLRHQQHAASRETLLFHMHLVEGQPCQFFGVLL
jgi:hypothetical protein